MSVGSDTPIGRLLSKLKGVKRSDGGYIACCPAHGDTHQSLGIDYVNGKVLLRCHVGCEVEAIMAAIGGKVSDLFAAPLEERSAEPSKPSSVTLAELAAHKRLPAEHLASLGWREVTTRHGSLIEIPYRNRDGSTYRMRLRTALSAKLGSRWGKGDGMIAYEPDGGELARASGYVVLVEGETDVATLLYAKVPALGIPGANATGTLDAHHLTGVSSAFVVQETDAAGAKFVESIRARLLALGIEIPVHTLKLPGAAKDPSALFQRDPAAFEATFHTALIEAAKPPPEPLDHVWKTLGEWGSLASEPPPRRWLLTRPDDECNGARQIGVLPMSKVGMLVAAGGVGKTMALIQLALAVATGRKWLDHFTIATPGKVLLALAEEDEEEIWRRVYQAARAMRLTDAQVELAGRNIVALPLAGTVVNLIKATDGETVETAMMGALRKRLERPEDWRLLILDPLSRFAGFDSEKDNAAATTFVATVESLLRVPGRPAILLAHHTHKASRQEGAQGGNAANARGASALIDGVRWAAELTPVSDGTVSFKVTKTNYSMGFEPVTLIRDADHGGYLRMQTAAEFSAISQKLADRRAKSVQTMRDLVIKTVSERPGLRSGNDLYAVIQGNRPAVLAALRDLKQEGFLKSTSEGLKLTERSGLDE